MIAIEASNLGKTYRLYTTPAQRLKEIILRKSFHEEFVALKDINFRISTGETFGIIGENGAGKSTLLKILAKTLKPTQGNLTINGRSAALLELGAGFNPELTGEENIYLNAYLLGLSKGEIDSKKQEIIDFSELGDSIKRPVKTYSSGMHVRLAFSIATSIDPAILIIDEALSVGDQHFQKKCIDRMMQFRKAGKTIIFCSHALYHVQELCSRAVWLKNGRIEHSGETLKVINAYTNWVRQKEADLSAQSPDKIKPDNKNKQKSLWLEDVRLTDEKNRRLEVVRTGQDIWLRGCIRVLDPTVKYTGHVGLGLHRNDGEHLFGVTSKMDGLSQIIFSEGLELCIRFPSLPLLAGQYFFVVILGDEHALHPYDIQRNIPFSVESDAGELGIVKLAHEWISP